MMNDDGVIRLGNMFGATGGNYAGNVYDVHGKAPTVNTCGGGYREPIIVEVEEDTEAINANKTE